MKKSGIGIATAILATGLMGSGDGLADTSDVTWQNRIEITKQGAHCADDANCFNRYHPAIPAAATAAPGDHLIFHTRDALGRLPVMHWTFE